MITKNKKLKKKKKKKRGERRKTRRRMSEGSCRRISLGVCPAGRGERAVTERDGVTKGGDANALEWDIYPPLHAEEGAYRHGAHGNAQAPFAEDPRPFDEFPFSVSLSLILVLFLSFSLFVFLRFSYFLPLSCTLIFSRSATLPPCRRSSGPLPICLRLHRSLRTP